MVVNHYFTPTCLILLIMRAGAAARLLQLKQCVETKILVVKITRSDEVRRNGVPV